MKRTFTTYLFPFLKTIIFLTVLAITASLFTGCKYEIPSSIDLASDTAWELSVDNGPWRGIKVPGAGYNSDNQDKPLIDQWIIEWFDSK